MSEKIACCPKILAYHPEIGVKQPNGVVSVIKLDLPDFQMTDEILKMLASTFSAKTAGELINKLKSRLTSQKFAAADCDNAVIVSGVTDMRDASDIPVVDHNTRIL